MMVANLSSAEAIDAVQHYQEDAKSTLSGERIEITLQAFQQLARYLSGIPARKNVIGFAVRFRHSVEDDRSSEPRGEVRGAANTPPADSLERNSLLTRPCLVSRIIGD